MGNGIFNNDHDVDIVTQQGEDSWLEWEGTDYEELFKFNQ